MGNGITWLKNNGFFNEAYYPYNAGGVLSVKTSKKINRDVNNNIICESSLDDIELRGFLELDGNNKLYYNGDTYESNGAVKRKYGEYDFSSAVVSDNSYFSTLTGFPCFEFSKISGSADYNNWSTKIRFFKVESSSYTIGKSDYIFGDGSQTTYIYVAPMGTTLSQATDLIQSLNAIFVLATPTTETADTFTNPMIVDGNGTEQFVDGRTVEMPVGHDTFYIPMN